MVSLHGKKRGQIAVAAALAVFILVLFIVVTQVMKKPVEVMPEATSAAAIRGLVTSCLQTEAQDGAYLIGQQGGYLQIGADRFVMDNLTLAPFSHRAKIVAPSVGQLEIDLGNHIDSKLPRCVIDGQRGIGQNLTFKTTKSTVRITPTQLTVTTDFPVTSTAGGRTETVHEFSSVIPVRIGMLRKIAEDILADRLAHVGYWDVTFLSGLAVPVEMRALNETYVVFTLLDNESYTRIEAPYVYNVVLDSPPNEPPRMALPEKFTLKVGQRFQYKVNAIDDEWDKIYFFAPNQLFRMSSEGEIDFTPMNPGATLVKIEAYDDKEAGSAKTALFEVSP